jgi:hypothetical protein
MGAPGHFKSWLAAVAAVVAMAVVAVATTGAS